jgi:hypothetical protein
LFIHWQYESFIFSSFSLLLLYLYVCICFLFVAVFSIFSVNTIIIVCVSVCDAGDNIDQKKEKLYIIRTVFIICVQFRCAREKEIIKKKTFTEEEMSPPAGFFPYLFSLPVLNFFFVCVLLFFFISFLSILSSLDIFLFVSLYTYILLWFLVKGSIFVYATCYVCLRFFFSFVKSCNSLWPMFCFFSS